MGIDWRAKLAQVNSIIYAKGAPLGSDEYFQIREIAAEATRSISDEAAAAANRKTK